MEKNYKLTIAYDGTRFFGWERQPDRETIQGKLESVLEKLNGTSVDVIGAGRTDAGVHARAMVASVRLDVKESCEEIRDYMNRYLPDAIAVREVKEAGERFHARYNAIGKTYRYTCFVGDVKPVFDRRYVTMLDYDVDVEKMRQAAAILTGEHDFRSFCGKEVWRSLCSAHAGRDSSVCKRDAFGRRQNDPRVGFPYKIRRDGNHGYGRGRPGTCQAAA